MTQLTLLYNEFFNSEKLGGLLLLLVTILSLVIANSPLQIDYINFWQTDIGGQSLVYWINEGLMAIFFLMIGLELEREFYKGELSDIKSVAFPIIGSIGGMIVPAIIFLIFNFDTTAQKGFGIPMATDITFAIAILSLFKTKVPSSLKIFITAFALIEDLGGILIIALVYSNLISLFYLALSLIVFSILIILNKLKVYYLTLYIIGGISMWYFMYHSGIHPAIVGILLAFVIPFGNNKGTSLSYKLQHLLHKPVAYFILPLFAMANTAIVLDSFWSKALCQASSLGIIAGLVIGKPLGIFLFTFLGSKIGWCKLPEDLKWIYVIGVGFLGGIGFTMALFKIFLAYDSEALVISSKMSILIASLLSGTIGYFILLISLKKPIKEDNESIN